MVGEVSRESGNEDTLLKHNPLATELSLTLGALKCRGEATEVLTEFVKNWAGLLLGMEPVVIGSLKLDSPRSTEEVDESELELNVRTLQTLGSRSQTCVTVMPFRKLSPNRILVT